MPKLLHLEGIRGLCALLVFYIHFLPRFAPTLLHIITLYQPRYIPVPIFFILSGRVLTASVQRHRRLQSIASSAVRRPIRLIFPIIGIIILNHTIRHLQLFIFSNKLDSINSWEDIFIHPFHFVLLQGPQRKPIPGVAWTIPLEFQGSILVYFLTYLFLSYPAEQYRPRFMISLFVLFWTCYCSSWLSHFVVGLMISDFSLTDLSARFKKWRYCWIVSSLLLGFVSYVTLHGPYTIGKQTDEYLRGLLIRPNGEYGASIEFWESNLSFLILCTAMMLYVEVTPLVQTIFSWFPFVYLGRVSFCLYLFHPTFVETLGRVVVGRFGYRTKSECHWSMIVATILLVLISEILTHVIDNPSVSVSKWAERGMVHGDWSIHSKTFRVVGMVPYKITKLLLRLIKGIFHRLPSSVRNGSTEYQYEPIYKTA
jgi:peptidoglycan/LPS O-acetylase OafA/YrhL